MFHIILILILIYAFGRMIYHFAMARAAHKRIRELEGKKRRRLL